MLAEEISFVALAIIVILAGVFTGLHSFSFELDFLIAVVTVVIIDAALSSLIFTSVSIFLGGIFLLRNIFSVDTGEDLDKPVDFTAIIPVYMESHVLEKSIESLRESIIDVDILIVCEEDDKESIKKSKKLNEMYEKVDYTVNTSEPGSKAGAINHAVKNIESEIFGVFDVDEEVHPRFVKNAVSEIRDGAEVIQGRAIPHPEGFFESLVFFEQYLAHLNFQLVYLFTGYRMAGSRTTVMKRSVWEETGGYNSNVLTEDFQFSFQCYKNRIDVQPLMSYPSTIEAAHNLRDWWNQRKRWMAGYLQVFFSLITDISPRDYRSLVSVLISFGSIIGSMTMVFLAAKFVLLIALSAETLFLLPISIMMLVPGLLGWMDSRKHHFNPEYKSLLLSPFMFSLYGLVALKAFIEDIFRKDVKWYRVEKSS